MNLSQLKREVVATRSSTWTYWIPCSLLAGIAIVATLGLSPQSLSYPVCQVQTSRESPISHIHSTLSDALTSPQSLEREHLLVNQFGETRRKGKLRGVHVRGLPAASLLVALGIRNGDVIKAAHDSKLGTKGYFSMREGLVHTLLSRLGAGPTIEIDRMGRRLHIHLMP